MFHLTSPVCPAWHVQTHEWSAHISACPVTCHSLVTRLTSVPEVHCTRSKNLTLKQLRIRQRSKDAAVRPVEAILKGALISFPICMSLTARLTTHIAHLTSLSIPYNVTTRARPCMTSHHRRAITTYRRFSPTVLTAPKGGHVFRSSFQITL